MSDGLNVHGRAVSNSIPVKIMWDCVLWTIKSIVVDVVDS